MDAGELPTAFLAANDRNAIGVLDVFVRAGIRVPQDVSVVGYDDTELSRLAPVNLTTVSQEAALQARGPSPWRWNASTGTGTGATELVLPPRLVVRGTTGSPPAADLTSSPRPVCRPGRGCRGSCSRTRASCAARFAPGGQIRPFLDIGSCQRPGSGRSS